MDARHSKFLRWLDSHDGVFTRSIAFDFGVSRWQLARGVETGQWNVYRNGCYIAVGAPDSPMARIRAAALRAGAGAIATGPSALAIHEFDSSVEGEYLSVPPNRNVRIESAVIIRDSLRPDASHRLGLLVASRERAVVDCLRVLEPDVARSILFRSLQLRWICPEAIDQWVVRLANTRGNTQLREMACVARSGAHAESELLLHSILSEAGISSWAANKRVYDEAGLIGVVDLLFEAEMVVVEVDGRRTARSEVQFKRHI